jgi:hypothetical protein
MKQGFSLKESLLYQDNTSSILIEKNGRRSCTNRTRHMNIRYFFVKDQVDSKQVRIEHCPTGDMLADFFTKPLQGTPFRKLRDHIMNIDPSSKHHSGNSAHRSVLRTKSSMDNAKPRDVMNDVTDVNEVATSPPRSYKDVLIGSKPSNRAPND